MAPWSHFGFCASCFFLFGRNLCGCQRPFASLSLGIVGKAGSLPSIPGTFWGFGFWDGRAGTRDASCVCSRVSIVLNCAFWGSNGLWFLLGKRILAHPRKWRWLFMGSVGFRLAGCSKFFLSREKSIAIACLSDHLLLTELIFT